MTPVIRVGIHVSDWQQLRMVEKELLEPTLESVLLDYFMAVGSKSEGQP